MSQTIVLSFSNETPFHLERRDVALKSGKLSVAGPPERVAPGTTASWETTTVGPGEGIDGHVTYDLVGTYAAWARLAWDWSLPSKARARATFSTTSLHVLVSSTNFAPTTRLDVRLIERPPMADVLHAAVLHGTWVEATSAQLTARKSSEASSALTSQLFDRLPATLLSAIYLGSAPWAMRSFWRRVALGYLDINFEVFDLDATMINQIDYWYSGAPGERSQLVSAFRAAAAAKNIDVGHIPAVVALPHPSPSPVGASGTNAVIDAAAPIDVVQHEIGHMLGLHHPWGFGPAGACEEYFDPFCVMGFSSVRGIAVAPPSGMALPSSQPTNYWTSAPRVSAATLWRYCSDFAGSQRVSRFSLNAPCEIVAPSTEDSLAPVLAVVALPGGGELLVEYRPAVGDDANVGPAAVVVHSMNVRWPSPDKITGDTPTDQPVVFEQELRPSTPRSPGVHGCKVALQFSDGRLLRFTVDPHRLVATSAVAAAATNDRIDVAVRTDNDVALSSWHPNTGWTPWRQPLRWVGTYCEMVAGGSDPPHLFSVTFDGVPVWARCADDDAVGLGWQRLGARPQNDTLIEVPKLPRYAPLTAVQSFAGVVAAAVDANGTLFLTRSRPGERFSEGWSAAPGPTLRSGTRVALAQRSPASVDIVAQAADGTFWHAEATDPGSGFDVSAFSQVPGGPFSLGLPTTLTAIGPLALSLSLIDSNGMLTSARWTAPTGWQPLTPIPGPGLEPGHSPCVVASGGDGIALLVLDKAGQISQISNPSGSIWSDWTSLPHRPARAQSALAVVSREPTHIEVFDVARGSNVLRTNWNPATGWHAGWYDMFA